MRFDWYQTSIDEQPRVGIDTLAKLGHELRPADALARKYRYHQGFQVHHNNRGVVATVLVGGNGKRIHAFASSQATDAFVDLVRTEWPDRHWVTRADSAEDYIDAGAYDRLRTVARRIAKRHRLRFPRYEDDLNPTAGRTQYIGSPTSDYRNRTYEKGFEELGKIAQLQPGQDLSTVTILNEATGQYVRPEEWTRTELQARPREEEGRYLLAHASPEEVWGFSPWAHEFAKEAMALDLERIVMRTRKISKDEEALRWMCQHYGGMLGRLHTDLGDWQAVGLQIGATLKQMNDMKTS